MITLIKAIHIAAIAIWSAGLIALPGFSMQLGYLRADTAKIGLHGEAVLRLQRAARLTYVGIASPAAFIAVASGILLIFQLGVIAPWFSFKLALVAGLVVAHALAGVTLVRIFEQPEGYARWRYFAATSMTIIIATAIITLTLAKPSLTSAPLPAAMSEPGALKTMLESFNPWQKP